MIHSTQIRSHLQAAFITKEKSATEETFRVWFTTGYF